MGGEILCPRYWGQGLTPIDPCRCQNHCVFLRGWELFTVYPFTNGVSFRMDCYTNFTLKTLITCVYLCAQFKMFSRFEFPALLKRDLATIPQVILTRTSGSLDSDLFWQEIWGDRVIISHGKQRTERENK